MKSWESGLAVCEVGQPGQAAAHYHQDEPIACAACYEFACDSHGDHTFRDDNEEWLCADCFDREMEDLADGPVTIHYGEYKGKTGIFKGVDQISQQWIVQLDAGPRVIVELGDMRLTPATTNDR
jgi:hypothetical protein